jgi:S-formylglutathione hydrolase FrmB
VFGPNSWLFLIFLACAFGALTVWAIRAKPLGLKIVASVAAFAVSTAFGVGLVNNFYDYYTSWGALYDDMTNSGTVGYEAAGMVKPQLLIAKDFGAAHLKKAVPPAPTPPPAPTLLATSTTRAPAPSARAIPATLTIPELRIAATADPGTGRLVRLQLPGQLSRIDRIGYVYLPPQYFEPAYANVRFPVLELLHGDPGDPTNWVYGLRLPAVMAELIHSGRVGPLVIVMPATFSGKHGNDCANVAGGEQNETYLSTDVPADVVADFRVVPQGPNWGIGGLSDGGYCAANLALRHRGSFGAVVSMDGFYTVDADLGVLGRDFGNNAGLLAANDPTDQVADSTEPLPNFWLMAGTGNGADFEAAQTFRSVVQSKEKAACVIVRGGTHAPPAWRAVMPLLLRWSWLALSGRPVPTGTTYVPS